MANVQSIIRDMQTLGQEERETLFNYLEEILVPASIGDEITDNVKENRFSKGKVCPRCEHDQVSRNGKYNGTQRYICKSCGKTFTDFTRSPRHNSKKILQSG